jgi:hypothetical protein
MVEQPGPLLLGRAVANVGILEDVCERASAVVLTDDVSDHVLLGAGACEEERERVPEQVREAHRGDCILAPMPRRSTAARFAERTLEGVDDAGVPERIVIWIERKPGAVWAVGRSINPQHRPSEVPPPDDYVFEGYELEDALEHANATLGDDVRVLEQDGRPQDAAPFGRDELLGPLERWFFGR